MLALVDVNNFYASCETLFRPDLKGKPVVVVSNNDGCVITRSMEAKQIGIRMSEPLFKLKQRNLAKQVHIFSSNYTLYADLSDRVMTTLASMSRQVEIYSIDEAFIDLGEQSASFYQQANKIRAQIKQHTGLVVGIGIAQTKTLAKLANYQAKHCAIRHGIVELSDREKQRHVMAKIDVNEVWGVGQGIGNRLHQMGIHTALQLADSPMSLIRKKFSVVLERLVRELRGEPCLILETA